MHHDDWEWLTLPKSRSSPARCPSHRMHESYKRYTDATEYDHQYEPWDGRPRINHHLMPPVVMVIWHFDLMPLASEHLMTEMTVTLMAWLWSVASVWMLRSRVMKKVQWRKLIGKTKQNCVRSDWRRWELFHEFKWNITEIIFSIHEVALNATFILQVFQWNCVVLFKFCFPLLDSTLKPQFWYRSCERVTFL